MPFDVCKTLIDLKASSKNQRYGLPALGSVQTEAENLPHGKSGRTYDGQEVHATCEMAYAHGLGACDSPIHPLCT